MNARRRLDFLALLVGLAVVIFMAYSYRYLLLSKLNIQAGAGEAALGLRQIAEIPLSGSPTRFDYQSIDALDGLLFIAHMDAD